MRRHWSGGQVKRGLPSKQKGESHGGTRKNRLLRSRKQFPMAGVGVPGGQCPAGSARELERKKMGSVY